MWLNLFKKVNAQIKLIEFALSVSFLKYILRLTQKSLFAEIEYISSKHLDGFVANLSRAASNAISAGILGEHTDRLIEGPMGVNKVVERWPTLSFHQSLLDERSFLR